MNQEEKSISRSEMPVIPTSACWICQSVDTVLIKPSNISGKVKTDSFAITDSTYGVTSALQKCLACGFIQSADLTQVLGFYEGLEDPSYEANREQRSLQSKIILETIRRHEIKNGRSAENQASTKKTLYDIGAGTGMLVEQAILMGYDASGVEPSRWLAKKAQEYSLPVALGTFPEVPHSKYDMITLIDVIEHVNDPVRLLRDINLALHAGGTIAVITPDVGSLIARALGFRWWHFRVAHIGYFNKKTLHSALVRAGFEKVHFGKAKWYFAADYLLKRVMTYIPKFLKAEWLYDRSPKFLKRFLEKTTVPLNLGDSMFAIYKKPL